MPPDNQDNLTEPTSAAPPTAAENKLPGQANMPRLSPRRKLFIAAGVGLLILVLVGVITVIVLRNKPSAKPDDKTSTSVSTPTAAQIDKFVTPTTKEQWLDEPKPFTLKDIYVDAPKATYLEVGKYDDNKIILASDGVSRANRIRWNLFEVDKQNAVRLIVRPQSTLLYTNDMLADIKQNINEQIVTYDNARHYDSLSLPDFLPLGDEKVRRIDPLGIGESVQQTPADITRQKVADFGQSTLFRLVETDRLTTLTRQYYELYTPIKTRIRMEYLPHSTQLAGYTWHNSRPATHTDAAGNTVFDVLMPVTASCEAFRPFVTVAPGLYDADLKAAGNTDTGQTVYHFSDPNHALVQKIYAMYGESAKKLGKQPVDKNTYFNSHALVVIKNKQSDNIIYTLQRFSAVSPCW